MFGTLIGDIQENIVVDGTAITGTSKYLDTGDIADYWGEGYFLVLNFANNDGVAPENVTVAGTPLDSDWSGVWKIGKADGTKAEKITVVTTDGENTLTQDYDLSGVVFQN